MANEEFGRLEHVEYDSYPTSPSSRASPPSVSKMARKYGGDRMRKIGDLCKNRLPPASAVQGMFLYELQRQTENEELFRGQLFKLAQQERNAAADQERMRGLEKRLDKLEKQAIHDRVAASTILVKNQGDKLNKCTNRVDTIDEKLSAVDAQLENLKTEAAEAAITLAAHRTEKAAAPEPDPILDIIRQEVDNLFVDRDNILAMLEDTKLRLTRAEGNLHALTKQRASSGRSSPALTQRLPVSTNNGTQLELGVPKGMAHVGLKKENPSIRSFSPGKQWS